MCNEKGGGLCTAKHTHIRCTCTRCRMDLCTWRSYSCTWHLYNWMQTRTLRLYTASLYLHLHATPRLRPYPCTPCLYPILAPTTVPRSSSLLPCPAAPPLTLCGPGRPTGRDVAERVCRWTRAGWRRRRRAAGGGPTWAARGPQRADARTCAGPAGDGHTLTAPCRHQL